MSVQSLEITTENLLNVVVQMPEHEFKRFIEKANSLRTKNLANKKSVKEANLILKINSIFPTDKRERYNQLYKKFGENNLDESEHQELLALNEEFEILNAKRIKYIGELANLRNQTIEQVINDFKIKTSTK
jgi:hypothetical protein